MYALLTNYTEEQRLIGKSENLKDLIPLSADIILSRLDDEELPHGITIERDNQLIYYTDYTGYSDEEKALTDKEREIIKGLCFEIAE